MADNVAITAGAGTTIASDDVAGVQYQRVKLALGADGAAADAPVGAGTASGVLRATLASDDPAVAALGAISGAAVITDANGTIQQYLRGLIKQWIAGTLVLGTGSNAIGKLAANAGVNVGEVTIKDISTGEYETVAASQTAQTIGATGAAGDYLSHVIVSPGTTSPGVVTILDNATSIVAFAGGTASISNLIPFIIPVGLYSVSGAWKITTGANVTCVAVGNFT